MQRRVETVSRIALTIALGMSATTAWAQAAPEAVVAAPADTAEAPAENTGGVEEIVVTAQFRSQNLQDTPLAITAVSGAMLEARSQTNIQDVANQAPSVTLKPQGAAYGPSLGASIRGIGQYDFNPALEPGVGVYVDDVYYSTLTGSVFDLLDLDRVEILRGPQGTLAGRNSIGGALKLYSKKPTGTNTGYIQATYGIRNRMDLRASFDLGLAENLALRVAGVAKRQGGYVTKLDYGCLNPGSGVTAQVTPAEGCELGKEGGVNYQAIRGQLRYNPTDRLEINIIGDYTNEDRSNAGQTLRRAVYSGTGDINPYAVPIAYDNRFVCGKYCNYASYTSLADTGRAGATANGRSKFQGFGISGQINYKLNDTMELTSITAYRDYTTSFSNDDDLSPLAHSLGRSNLDFWSFSQELRLNGSLLDDAIEYTVGGYYSDQRSVYLAFQDLRYAGLPQFIQNDPVNADSKAAFAHVSWKATDKLTFTGGIRYTDEHKDYTFVRVAPNGGPLTGSTALINGQVGNYDGNRVDYRANVQYAITPDIMAYGQYATGFKGGGINPRPFFPTQVRSFGPETLETYELGLKTDLFDRLLRFNVAGFYSNYNDIQLTQSFCDFGGGFPSAPCAAPSNTGDAKIKGFEIEAGLRPAQGLMIDGSMSYIHFKYKSIDPTAGGPGRPNNVQYNDVPPYMPTWKWAVGVQYEVPVADIGTITPRIDASYQSVIYSNAANRFSNRIDAYTLANARLTYKNKGEDVEVSLEVTNLFDKYYVLTNFDQSIAPTGGGFSLDQPGRPREWAVSLKKKF